METHGRTIGTTTIAGTELSYIEDDPTIARRFESEWDERELFERIKEASFDPSTYPASFWDVGACIGVHSSFASHYYDSVLAFEPVDVNVGSMIDNFSINGNFDTIDIKHTALADRKGAHTVEIRESTDAGYGRHSLAAEQGKTNVLRTDTIDAKRGDDVAREQGVPNVVKIDVEGAEGVVLEGMRETLRSPECRHIFVETHAPNDDPNQPSYEDFGYTLGQITNLLMGAGFSIEHCGQPYLIYGQK